MDKKNKLLGRLGKGAAALALIGTMGAAGAGTALAADYPFGSPQQINTTTTPASNYLKTYGVRAGSAGPDFLGITNTNFDFTAGSASSSTQYTGYTSATTRQLAGIAIWGGTVNEAANPYYANLGYHASTGTASSYNEATTWMSNPTTSSWGDSNGTASTKVSDGTATIAGLEYSPEIIFGANKTTNWNLDSNGDNSSSNIYDSGYSADYINNDSTNLWTQVYTMGKLATAADTLKTGTSKTTRYDSNSATTAAIDYEKATKGQMLYIASQIATHNVNASLGVAKKTVAYLYAIDSSGTGYFFVPTAANLLSGNDTGASSSNSLTNPNTNYAANNGTIDFGYMDTLPFITNTFDSGTETSGTIMKVEDIYKTNPTCTVGSSASTALSGVDVIIYNTTTQYDLTGTSGGKNSSGVMNNYGGDALTLSEVQTWAAAHGFNGSYLAGDDYGTSTNQNTSIANQAPLLYCQRNYTSDKNARAAWAFAEVYPSLYSNATDTYGYWVDTVYHVTNGANNTTNYVPAVVKYMTNQSDETVITYTTSTASDVSADALTGYTWWKTGLDTNNDGTIDVPAGSTTSPWSSYKYYTGSSRASYYATTTAAQRTAKESANTIGIFTPSALWTTAQSAS